MNTVNIPPFDASECAQALGIIIGGGGDLYDRKTDSVKRRMIALVMAQTLPVHQDEALRIFWGGFVPGNIHVDRIGELIPPAHGTGGMVPR